MKKVKIVIGVVLITVIVVSTIVYVTVIRNSNVNAEQDNFLKKLDLEEITEETSEEKIEKVVGMDINEAIKYIEDNHFQIEAEEQEGIFKYELEVNSNYDIVETNDETLFGKVKGYKIEPIIDYRVVSGQSISFEVYGKNYSLEEKQKVVEDIYYRMRTEYSEIDSSNITKSEVIELLSKYNIKYEFENEAYTSEIKGFKDLQNNHDNKIVPVVDINTFDLDTLKRFEDGIVATVYFRDNEDKRYSLNPIYEEKYKEDYTLVFSTYIVNNDTIDRFYNYLKDREEVIPNSEFINKENKDDTLPILLNTCYMAYSNVVTIAADNGGVKCKKIYFTYNNKVLIEDYRPGIRYLIGTYNINNDIITVKVTDIKYNEFATDYIKQHSSVSDATFKIIDKNTLQYESTITQGDTLFHIKN